MVQYLSQPTSRLSTLAISDSKSGRVSTETIEERAFDSLSARDSDRAAEAKRRRLKDKTTADAILKRPAGAAKKVSASVAKSRPPMPIIGSDGKATATVYRAGKIYVDSTNRRLIELKRCKFHSLLEETTVHWKLSRMTA